MSEQEKKRWNQAKNISEIIKVSLWPPSSQNLNNLHYTIWNFLENKTNATSHPNIGSLKTSIEKEWNKIPGEFTLKACKSFRWRIDIIILKKGGP